MIGWKKFWTIFTIACKTMRRFLTIFVATIAFMSCGNNPETGSITMNLYYTGENGNARKFVEEMESSGTADAIRAEDGNLRYDYFFSAANSETVLLIDSWTSQEAIDAHHATPMMQTIAALREKYDLHMTAERYHRAEQDMPSSDKSFIRE
jgi:quinol monooxygenase YgiN